MASCSLDEILSNVISAGGARAPVTSFAQRIQVTGVDAVADHHQCVHSVCMASPKYTKMLLFLLSASVILYGCPALALGSSRFVASVLAKPESVCVCVCVCVGVWFCGWVWVSMVIAAQAPQAAVARPCWCCEVLCVLRSFG